MRHSKLTEGMRSGDLADLVLPLISVDEYVSKVSPKEAIVIGFYVHDQDAAVDLNRFLQKSPAPLLDTEVSPAPDQHGFFLVFVELMHDERLADNVFDLLAEIKNLVDVDEWNMRVRDLNELVPFTIENFNEALKRSARNVKETAIIDFLRPSSLDNAEINDDLLILEGCGERYVFRILEFAQTERLMEHGTGIALDLRSVAYSNRIRRLLGEGWGVSLMGKNVLLHPDADERSLLLRP